MTTPRQSNQSVKYHRVGVPLPAKKKKGKDAVGKAFCFMHESAKATVDRKEGTRSSHLGTKSKVEESKRHMKGDRNKVSNGALLFSISTIEPLVPIRIAAQHRFQALCR